MNQVASLLAQAFSSLKPFQQASVEAVCTRFTDPDHSHRVLVADEVGLGKTVIAKGVIAKLLQQHINTVATRPFRVTYICSNLALAEENRRKLAVFSGEMERKYVKQPSFSRLLDIAAEPQTQDDEPQQLIEVCTLTPSTSFKLTTGYGNKWERCILFHALVAHPMLQPFSNELQSLFKTDYIGDDSWKSTLIRFAQNQHLSAQVLADFHAALEQKPANALFRQASWLKVLTQLSKRWAEDADAPDNQPQYRAVRIACRYLLAQCCAANISADLFILDEFQRFKALTEISGESEEALIAQQVFQRGKQANILMLSATPFKAMTQINDDDDSDHQKELEQLLGFLTADNKALLEQYQHLRQELQVEVLSLRDPAVAVNDLSTTSRDQIQQQLRQYILRNERSQLCAEFDNIYQSNEIDCLAHFSQQEVRAFRSLAALEKAVNEHMNHRAGSNLIEFAKSAPWVMSFLQTYKFRENFEKHRDKANVKTLIRQYKRRDNRLPWLDFDLLNSYQLNVETDTPHAKVKAMTPVVFRGNGERLLWVPPAKPYYRPSGAYLHAEDFGKSLLFSAWGMVPRAMSGIWSYEAERRLKKRTRTNVSPRSSARSTEVLNSYFSDTSHSQILRFSGDSPLNQWCLLYPARVLSDIDLGNGDVELSELIQRVTSELQPGIESLRHLQQGGDTDNNWYLLAMLLLDRFAGHQEHTQRWFQQCDEVFSDTKGPQRKSGRQLHLERISQLLGDPLQPMGTMPEDLAEVLATLAIAAPGICAFRSSRRLWQRSDSQTGQSVSGEAMPDEGPTMQIAAAICQLFNHDYARSVLDATTSDSQRWWRRILSYCAAGNLQAMLDEYGHLLCTSGMDGHEAGERFQAVLGLKSTHVDCQFWHQRKDPPSRKTKHGTLRCHYAVPLGTQKMTDDKGLDRIVHVRDAFNSPFRPFVLSSTSIGQEGLDFHWYCDRVIHWNLPTNPIDIEQREGRVNRFKSYVVRKRIAEQVQVDCQPDQDNWQLLFDAALRQSCNDLAPFWFHETGAAKIERIVPMYPMSKETRRYQDALRILSLYRLSFGQPRQEELLDNLLAREFTPEELKMIKTQLLINLSPQAFQKQYPQPEPI